MATQRVLVVKQGQKVVAFRDGRRVGEIVLKKDFLGVDYVDMSLAGQRPDSAAMLFSMENAGWAILIRNAQAKWRTIEVEEKTAEGEQA